MEFLGFPVELWLVWLVGLVGFLAVMVKIGRKPKQGMVDASVPPKVDVYKADSASILETEGVEEKLSDEEKKEILEKLQKV